MSFPLNHKTVFVIDHSFNFSSPCVEVEFDFHKSRAVSNPNFVPTAPIAKSIWTCATESALEYCRLVWDIFPEDKLIQFVVCDKEGKSVNSWQPDEQNSGIVAAGLAMCGQPDAEQKRKDYSIQNGLAKALEVLCEVTAAQKKSKARKNLVNRGRIVLLAYMQDEKRIDQVIRNFQQQLDAANENAQTSDTVTSIDQLSLEIVHCYSAASPEKSIREKSDSPIEVSPNLSYQVYSVDAGEDLSRKLLYLALCHYELASTTVTGIPMKEEQNASSSANYDVELFHPADAHSKLLASHFDDGTELAQTVKEGCEYKTITLKWCTPRGSVADMHHCTAAVRITPTDVNSRPSSCLTNFLLAGRSVMLEMPRRSGTKFLSHMLTSHGGEIFMHTLSTTRSILEDPPSISEGAGGRVTDYRINDVREIMKANKLAPWFSTGALEKEARPRLARHSLVCPFTISATTIFNMAVLEPLQKIMLQDELTEEDMADCRKVIYTLLSMENKSDQLPVPVQTLSNGKTKTLKKDEQYKMMYSELETFLANHGRTERHVKILDCLLEVRNKPLSERPPIRAQLAPKSKIEAKAEFDMSLDGVLRSTTESPMSPTADGKSMSLAPFAKRPRQSGQSLLDMWTKKVEKEQARRHVPFHGLRNLGDKAKLYMSLERMKEGNEANGDTKT